MKKLVLILSVALMACEKEPTCISCVASNGGHFEGCIEDYEDIETTQDLIDAISPLLGSSECEEY